MAVDVKSVSRPGWSPLPHEGCEGVDVKGLIRLNHVSLALLRFGTHATIHEHPADMDVDVICLEGEGYASVSGEKVVLRADEVIRWPAGVRHRLWTTDSTMITLMVEHRQYRPTKSE